MYNKRNQGKGGNWRCKRKRGRLITQSHEERGMELDQYTKARIGPRKEKECPFLRMRLR